MWPEVGPVTVLAVIILGFALWFIARLLIVSRLPRAIFALSIVGGFVAWCVASNPTAGAITLLGLPLSLIGPAIAALVAALTLVYGRLIEKRVASIEAGRYPRMRPGAAERIAQRLEGETAQTATIDGEGGDDIREVAAVLQRALILAQWKVSKLHLSGTLWDEGNGILIYHTAAAARAAQALADVLKNEGLSVSDAGDCTTGNPVHIAFRRP